jgi:PHD/YefM family antitoxin component YafN of YafNO toxin-antitoxin module
MTKAVVSSREFNQDTIGAKRPASKGPVIITDRGRPAHLLLSFEDYQELTRNPSRAPENIIDLLDMPDLANIPFEALRIGGISRAADLS